MSENGDGRGEDLLLLFSNDGVSKFCTTKRLSQTLSEHLHLPRQGSAQKQQTDLAPTLISNDPPTSTGLKTKNMYLYFHLGLTVTVVHKPTNKSNHCRPQTDKQESCGCRPQTDKRVSGAPLFRQHRLPRNSPPIWSRKLLHEKTVQHHGFHVSVDPSSTPSRLRFSF